MASPDKKAFLLRVDPALLAQVERMAASELRSVNGEVEHLLRAAVAAHMSDGAPRGRRASPASKPTATKATKAIKSIQSTKASKRARR